MHKNTFFFLTWQIEILYYIYMGISYRPLFVLLAKHGMSKTDLRTKIGISTNTLAKFAKSDYISGETIEKLCAYFNCQPGDIMEYVPGSKTE